MTTELYYKDVRVSPSSDLGRTLLDLKQPNLSPSERETLRTKAERIYQDCEAEYQKWWR